VSVTAANGFVAAGVHAGIRRAQADLAVVRSVPPAVGAAMFTRNRVLAAPLVVSTAHLAEAEPQAVVVNSGVANAATGVRGELDAVATAVQELPDSTDLLTDDDLHLALWVLYELHYSGFDGVDPDLEWDPDVLRARRLLEAPFEAELRRLGGHDDRRGDDQAQHEQQHEDVFALPSHLPLSPPASAL